MFLSSSVFAQDFVPGEVLVKFKSLKNASTALKALQFMKTIGTVQEELAVNGSLYFHLKLKEKNTLAALEKIKSNPLVQWAEPNYIYTVQGFQDGPALKHVPHDELFSNLWGLDNATKTDIGAVAAWDVEQGSKDIKVAVIDTGIDYNHQDLKDQMWTNDAEANGTEGVDDDKNGVIDDVHGAAFLSGKVSGNPLDDHSHGTHCAGTIGAQHDDKGVAGVMGHVSFVAVKFLSKEGAGSTADAVKAIQYATSVGVNIMSNSWGGGGFSQALEDAIKEANAKGIIFVAAAGNSSLNNDVSANYPSNYNVNNIIAVGAYSVDDKVATFSNYGKTKVHVFAPGVKIWSSVLNNLYASYSGTSMATPHTAGVVGLYLSKFPDASIDEVKANLMETTVKSPAFADKAISSGRINVANLLQ